MSSSTPPLAIVGIGCLFPKANHVGAYWANLKNGVDGITEVPATHWNPADYFDADPKKPDHTYARRGGFLDPYPFPPAEFGIAPNDLEATDTSQLLGLVAAKMALADAGIQCGMRNAECEIKGHDASSTPHSALRTPHSRISVILGVTGTLELVVPLGARLGHPHWKKAMRDAGVPEAQIEEAVKRIGESYVPWQEQSFPGLLGNVVAGRIANRLDLHGTNCVVDAACASSLSALHLASMELSTGRADVVVTGGVDTFNDIFMYMCFSKTPALSPTGDSRPFSANADGTILGEGLGIVVLKRLADAERDGDRIYAVIKGIGTSSDGKGNAIYAPSADGQKRCLLEAYEQAGVTPDTIELVEAHGTGTKVGDATEIAALTDVFSQSAIRNPQSAITAPWCALGSVKSQIGHTKAAAGAAGLIKAVLALYHKVLPPTIKVEKPADAVASANSPFYVNTTKRPWLPREHPRRAGVSAFGFGGSNFHCVLEEHRREKPDVDWDGDVQIVALSAGSREELKKKVETLRCDSWDALCSEATASRRTFATDAAFRLLMVVAKDSDVAKLRDSALRVVPQQGEEAFVATPDGIYFGQGKPSGKLGVLFPGQGSQYVGMLRDLACQFPQMHQVLDEANQVYVSRSPNRVEPAFRLSDFVYPPPAFTAEARANQEQALRATHVAQPAIGAVSLGALRVLDSFGVQPEAAAGHSFGELTALCAAGCYDAESLHTLSRLRGQLMAEVREGDPGAMLAVHASAESIEDVLRAERLELVIANRNSPQQAVLSGATREIERAAKLLGERKMRSTRLPVAAAFHSPLVADAERPFRQALEKIRIEVARLPVFANSSALEYPDNPEEIRALLAGQLARPVDFVNEIRAMVGRGVRTFIEVGPGNTLTRLVEAILRAEDSERRADAFALDASNGKRSGIIDLAHALARIAARGHAVRLSAWEEHPPHPLPRIHNEKPALVVPICGANYVKPRIKAPAEPPLQAKSNSKVDAKPEEGKSTQYSVLSTRNSVSTIRPNDSPSAAAEPSLSPAAQQHPSILSPQSLTPTAPQARTISNPRTTTPSNTADHTKTTSPLPTPTRKVSVSDTSKISQPALAQVLQVTQEGLAAFQKLQEQTAQLHRQFLQGQEAAQTALARLVEQQQQVILASMNGVHLPVMHVPAQSQIPTSSGSAAEIRTNSAEYSVLSTEYSVSPAQMPSTKYAEPAIQFSVPGVQNFSLPVEPVESRSCASDQIEKVLLDTVAEKTGYPAEMLHLDMGLDADLGIDSIKRVEILSALQEKLPEAPAIKPEHLGTLNTLRQIVEFLAGSSPQAAADGPKSEVGSPQSAIRNPQLQDVLLAVVAEKTGYPVEMLNLDMGLDADLGIDSIKRVEILSTLQERLPEAPTVKPEHLGTLNTLRQIVDFLAGDSQPADAPAQQAEFSSASADRETPIANPTVSRISRQTLRSAPLPFDDDRPALAIPAGATFWLVAERTPLADQIVHQLRSRDYVVERFQWSDDLAPIRNSLAGLIFVAPATTQDEQLLRAFQWLRHCGSTLRNCAKSGGAVLATIATIDGSFGLSRWPENVSPLVGGFAGLAKTAGHEWPEVSCKAIDIATHEPNSLLVEELFRRGPSEAGIAGGRRSGIELVESETAPVNARLLEPSDVVVVSGGARGVTAEAAIAMANTYRCTLVLLGRTPVPESEPEWLAGLKDEREIKRALGAKRNGGVTPKELSRRYHELAAQREIRTNLGRMEAAGSRVMYRCVDVRDRDAVEATIADVRRQAGPITGIVHGAGVIEDRRIEDKTDEQFDRVYGTKVEGLRNLLSATAGDPLKILALFSSSTGRFGRTGQVDYAVANEVLNKVARQQATLRPSCRVVSINWGPWEGGMVTPALQKIFAEEGIGLIPLQEGARFLLSELSAADRPIEIVAGVWKTPAARPQAETVSEANSFAFERLISVEECPVLSSHVIDGKAVFPLVLHMEWLAHAALHNNPGLTFAGFDDVRVLNGIKLAPAEAIMLRAFTSKPEKRDGQYRVAVELRSELPGGRVISHSRGVCILGTKAQFGEPKLRVEPGRAITVEDVYESILFHGEAMHGLEEIGSLSANSFETTAKPSPPPHDWLRQPLRPHWILEPLVLDAAFQAMVVWGVETSGLPNLPCALSRYRQFGRHSTSMHRVVARVSRPTDLLVRAEFEILDESGRLVASVEGAEFVSDSNLVQAFRRKRLAAVTT